MRAREGNLIFLSFRPSLSLSLHRYSVSLSPLCGSTELTSTRTSKKEEERKRENTREV